jgi:hypothetical protein
MFIFHCKIQNSFQNPPPTPPSNTTTTTSGQCVVIGDYYINYVLEKAGIQLISSQNKEV